VDDCPFSHKVAKEKMPTCSYFLRGVCNRDNCPYRHVNVSKTAEVCQDFVKGFCSLGEKVKLFTFMHQFKKKKRQPKFVFLELFVCNFHIFVAHHLVIHQSDIMIII
jgi:hypothetical protein